MPAIPAIMLAVSVAGTVAGTIQKKKATDAAAATATQVSNFNAAVDRADAVQTDLDAQANVRALRRDAATYMSRQTSAYVASGVLADTGSPLVARATTAGRFAMREQQMWTDANAKQQRLESAAQAGLAEGKAQADQYHMEGTAALINGATKVAGQIYGGYQGGDFSFMKGTGTNDLSADLYSTSGQNMLRGG